MAAARLTDQQDDRWSLNDTRGVDPTMWRASAARVYDYLLGGRRNFGPDRELAEKLLAAEPNLRFVAHENRAFLRRAVLHLVAAGVRQFLDLGSGIPAPGSVQEIAQAAAPECRVVSVDIDPVAVACSKHILLGNAHADAILADVQDAEAVLRHRDVTRLIDLDQPVAVLAVAVLHFLPDDAEVSKVLAAYRDRVAAGSYLVISHLTADTDDGSGRDRAITQLGADHGITCATRSRLHVAGLFGGWPLLKPGLTSTAAWRREAGQSPADPWQPLLAGVARKPSKATANVGAGRRTRG